MLVKLPSLLWFHVNPILRLLLRAICAPITQEQMRSTIPTFLSGLWLMGGIGVEDRIYCFILFWVSQLFHPEYILLI